MTNGFLSWSFIIVSGVENHLMPEKPNKHLDSQWAEISDLLQWLDALIMVFRDFFVRSNPLIDITASLN